MGDGSRDRRPKNLRRRDVPSAGHAPDAIDLKILMRLQADGRITNQDLADAVGLSPSACLARVRRLEQRGVIAGYHARLAPESLGPCLVVFAPVTLKSQHPADLLRFERALSGRSEIVEVAQVSGPFDYLLKVVTRDVQAWRELSDELIAADIGVEKITSHVLMKDCKPFAGYPLPG